MFAGFHLESVPDSEFLLGTGAEDGVTEADFPGKEPWPFFFSKYLFMAHWVFIAAPGLSLVASSRGLLSGHPVQASRGGGFSCGARALGFSDFRSCGTWAQ